MKPGQRVMILDHPAWAGGKLKGYEGVYHANLVGMNDEVAGYVVTLPFLKRILLLRRDLVCPVYNDCETCGYAAWGNVNAGTDKAPEWHHYCAWHLATERDKLAL